jgi:hypothetical protein
VLKFKQTFFPCHDKCKQLLIFCFRTCAWGKFQPEPEEETEEKQDEEKAEGEEESAPVKEKEPKKLKDPYEFIVSGAIGEFSFAIL